MIYNHNIWNDKYKYVDCIAHEILYTNFNNTKKILYQIKLQENISILYFKYKILNSIKYYNDIIDYYYKYNKIIINNIINDMRNWDSDLLKFHIPLINHIYEKKMINEFQYYRIKTYIKNKK